MGPTAVVILEYSFTISNEQYSLLQVEFSTMPKTQRKISQGNCTDFVIALSSTFQLKSVTILSCKLVHVAVAILFLLASYDVQNACRAIPSRRRLAENLFGTYIMHDPVSTQGHSIHASLGGEGNTPTSTYLTIVQKQKQIPPPIFFYILFINFGLSCKIYIRAPGMSIVNDVRLRVTSCSAIVGKIRMSVNWRED